MNPIKVSLCGLGLYGAKRLKALEANSTLFEVVGVFDSDSQKPLQHDKAYELYSNFKQTLNDDSEIVFICTPNNTHFEIISDILKNKKSVFCEKPLCINLEELKQLQKLARQNKCTLHQGSNLSFFPVSQYLINYIKSRNVKPKTIKSSIGHNSIESLSEWHLSKSMSGGGSLIDNGIHILNLLSKIFNHIEFQSASFSDYVGDVEKQAQVHCLADQETSIFLETSWKKSGDYCDLEIVYDDSRLTTKLTNDQIELSLHNGLEVKRIHCFTKNFAINSELKNFHELFLTRHPYMTRSTDLEVIFECYNQETKANRI